MPLEDYAGTLDRKLWRYAMTDLQKGMWNTLSGFNVNNTLDVK
jgi:hypothetical protein